MHNIKNNFDKILQTIKSFPINDFDGSGNINRPGPKPKFTDLEIISLSLTSEYMSIDSENLLYKKIKSCHLLDFPNLIDRTQYNRRKKDLFFYIDNIRKAMAEPFLDFENYMIIDSMPIEICKLSRAARSKICRDGFSSAPDYGFCASQNLHFYGYKLHGVCSINGIFHSIDLTKASLHDNEILQDLNEQLSDTVLIGDKGYIGKEVQLDLFQTASIKLHTPMRNNQKDFRPFPYIFSV